MHLMDQCACYSRQVLHLARTMLGANLSAFEFVDSRCLAAIRTCAPQLLQRYDLLHRIIMLHDELCLC